MISVSILLGAMVGCGGDHGAVLLASMLPILIVFSSQGARVVALLLALEVVTFVNLLCVMELVGESLDFGGLFMFLGCAALEASLGLSVLVGLARQGGQAVWGD